MASIRCRNGKWQARVVRKGFPAESGTFSTKHVAFELGEMASFTDKYGVTHVGHVTRRNAKTVTVDCKDATWRVPPRMLRRVVDV